VLNVSIDDDSSLDIELGIFVENMKEVIKVIDSMLALMLNPRLKSFTLINYFNYS
jgi:hypothetical protein